MSIRLSEFELDVMTHFWSDGELSAPQLHERIGGQRGVAYSTVKTIVDRLEQKGAIERVANRGRTIFYAPAIKRERVRKPLVKAFLRRLFGNDLRPLFAQLLQDEKLSGEELEYLRKLVAEAERSRK
jgi:BlaI family penicillinase repressor